MNEQFERSGDNFHAYEYPSLPVPLYSCEPLAPPVATMARTLAKALPYVHAHAHVDAQAHAHVDTQAQAQAHAHAHENGQAHWQYTIFHNHNKQLTFILHSATKA